MRTKEKIYEIRLGRTESVIIQNAQAEFMGKVFDLARESFLKGKELEIVWTNVDDDTFDGLTDRAKKFGDD